MTTTTYKHHEQVMCCQDHNDIIIIIASDLSALETGILCHCFLKSDIYYDFMMTCMPHYCQCSGRISLNLNSVQPLRIYSLLSRIPSEDGSSRSEMKKLHSPTKINQTNLKNIKTKTIYLNWLSPRLMAQEVVCLDCAK